jgi:hypothetical protein
MTDKLAAPADVGKFITYYDGEHVHIYRWIVETVEHIPYHRDYPDAPLAILRCHEKPAPQE